MSLVFIRITNSIVYFIFFSLLQQKKASNHHQQLHDSPGNQNSKEMSYSKIPSARSNSSNQSSDLADQFNFPSSFPSTNQPQMPPAWGFPGL